MSIEEMKVWIQKYNQELADFVTGLSNEDKITFLILLNEQLQEEQAKCR